MSPLTRQNCVERVQLIRMLQKKKRLTLSEIKGYMQSAARPEDIRALMSLSDTVFGLDEGTRYTRQQVQQTSGLSAATLRSLVEAGLLVPRNDSSFDEQDVAIASMFAQSLSWGLSVRDFTFYARCARDLVEHEMGIRARLIGGLGIEANAALTEEMTRSARVYRAYVFERTFQQKAVARGSLEKGDRP